MASVFAEDRSLHEQHPGRHHRRPRTLHFARAAEALGISAPALTEQVQELERRVGARLFLRSKRSVALSDAGKLFLEELRPAMEQLDRAEQVAMTCASTPDSAAEDRLDIGFVRAPTRRSSSCTCSVSAGAEMPSASAARAKCSVRATARKARRWRSSMPAA